MRSLSALSCLLLFAACGDGDSISNVDRPDVCLIVVDTLRADRLQPYGCDRPTSPHIQTLADAGVVFEDVTAQGSWTKPSMVALLQGRYLTEYRDIPFAVSPTMAELFRDGGYRTMAVVGNFLLSKDDGYDRGFQHFDHIRSQDRAEGERKSRKAEEIVAAAKELLPEVYETDADGNRPPVFSWFHFMEPHSPYIRHPQFEDELPVEDMLGDRRAYYETFTTGKGPEAQWQSLNERIAFYDQEVRASDHWIEILLGEIEQAGGDMGDTIVVIASDHGEGLWQKRSPQDVRANRTPPHSALFGGHGKVQDQNVLATPLILRGPGIPAGTRVAEPVANVDLVPTLLSLCSLPSNDYLHGRDLTVTWAGDDENGPIYSRVMKERSFRDEEGVWKLVVPTELGKADREVRLYETTVDPLERNNLAAERPDVVEAMMAKMQAVEAEFPTVSSFGRTRSKAEQADMAALGYTGDDG